MAEVTVKKLVNVIMCVLRVANRRDPYIKTMCGSVWSKNLSSLSIDILEKKLHFLILHCSEGTIEYLCKCGIFQGEKLISILKSVLRLKNLSNRPAFEILNRSEGMI